MLCAELRRRRFLEEELDPEVAEGLLRNERKGQLLWAGTREEDPNLILPEIIHRLPLPASSMSLPSSPRSTRNHSWCAQSARPLQADLLPLVIRPREDRADELQHLEPLSVGARSVEERNEDVGDEATVDRVLARVLLESPQGFGEMLVEDDGWRGVAVSS